MVKNKTKWRIGMIAFAAILLISGLFFTYDTALAVDETGNFCIADYGVAGCTAADSGVRELLIVNLIESCTEGTTGFLTADFRITIQTAVPDRYDYGFFIALDGGSASTGDSCYHGYLQPPLDANPTYGDSNGDTIDDLYELSTTPLFTGYWTNGNNTCGDIEGGPTQAIRYLYNLTIPCVDNNLDGIIDLNACASWDNDKTGICSDVKGAVPGTSSKCGCTDINLYGPTAVTMVGLNTKSSASFNWLIPSIAAVLFIVSVGAVLLVKKLTPQQT